MPKIVWLPEALEDLMRHFDYLKQKNIEAAGLAAQAIRDAGFSLANAPYKGTILRDGSDRRKLFIPFGKYGFVIHYYLDNETIFILRVYQARENRPT
jgi:plasmid stabilization system protein ParE